MIPVKILSKTGAYKIKKQGVTIDVMFIDNEALLEQCIAQLRPQIGPFTAVGLLLKNLMLQICVGSRCLLVQLDVLRSVPKCLKDFLADKEICFVSASMHKTHNCLSRDYETQCHNGVEVTELVARVLRKPGLWGSLPTIAAEVGVSLEKSPNQEFSWSGRTTFTDEEMKWVIHEVYASHLIGSKVLAML